MLKYTIYNQLSIISIPFRSFAPTVVLLAAALLLSPTHASAQVLTGEIDGTVHDASGAVIPNATVTITNSDQNLVERTVKTDSVGQFTAPLLSVGSYSINVEAPGFQTSVINNIQVHVGQPSAIPVSLSAGQVSQTVDVSASETTAQLDSASSSTLIEGKQAADLPLSSRNYLQLLYLQPGISGGIPGPDERGNITFTGQVNTQSFSVNGNGTAANAYFVDGADTLKRAGQQPVAFPGVDFIQEINLQRADYGAEFGGAGAAFVSVQTKSGASSFHGGAFGFFRSQIFNANTYLNNSVGAPRGAQRYADFGYYVGGPVLIPGFGTRSNPKTFFFFGQEYLRSLQQQSVSITNISTAAQRMGVFGVPVCVTYAASGACAATGSATSIATTDPTAQQYLKDIINKLPLPNNPNDPQGLITQSQGTNNERQTLIRIDHQFNSKLSVFFRYLDDPFNLVVPGGFQLTSQIPGVATSSMTNGSTNWLGHFTYVINPNHILEGGYATRANWVTAQPIGYLEASNSPDIHVQLPYASTLGQVPHININGSNFAVTGPYNERNPVTQVFLNNTNSLGRHTFKLGVNVELELGGSTAASANAGTFTFSPGTLVGAPAGSPAGTPVETQFDQAFANFLLGRVTTFTQTATDVAGTNHSNIYEGYVQDDFHISRRLTLTAGMRYSYFAAATSADLAGHPQLPVLNFDPATYSAAAAPALTATGVVCTAMPCYGGKTPNPNYSTTNGIIVGDLNSPFGTDVQTTPNKTFAPRVGFTYDVFGDGKTALRGGFGIYYFAVPANQAKFATSQDPPNVNNVTINNTTFANPSGGTTPPISPTILQALQINDPAPYSEQYSLDVQHEVFKFLLDVGFYGNHGVHLFANIDTNQAPQGLYAQTAGLIPGTPNPVVTAGNTADLNNIRPYLGYSSITSQADIFSSNYNSLQATVRRPVKGGGIITGAYTWSNGLTNARTPQNSANIAAEYGRTTFDRTNVFNVSFTYPIPIFLAQKGLVGRIVGGFEITGIGSYGSGQFLTETTNAVDPGGVGLLVGPATGRPDYITNPNAGALHAYKPSAPVKTWFNISSFALVPAGQFRVGDDANSNILGPGYESWDLSVHRNIRLYRETNFQFRAEAFNAFNHSNPSAIGTTVGATNNGQVTAYGPNRTLQLGGRFTF